MINRSSIGSLLVFVGVAASVSHTLAADSSIATQLQENRVTQERQLVSPSGQWKVSLSESREGGNYKLVLENRSGVKHEIDESGKPDFRIVWSESENYLAVSKPTGFATMISIYALAKDLSGTGNFLVAKAALAEIKPTNLHSILADPVLPDPLSEAYRC